MYQVWEGDLFLFNCIPEEADMYTEEGYTVIQVNK